MAINKERPWHMQSFPNGQIDITNDLIVFNIHPLIPESLVWAGMSEDDIDRIKGEYAHWVLQIINREVIKEQERAEQSVNPT